MIDSSKRVRIEIIIGGENNPDVQISAQADEETVNTILKSITQIKPNYYILNSPVICENIPKCTDYPTKCKDCQLNEARSFYKKRNGGENDA
jgi:hypothetical protein